MKKLSHLMISCQTMKLIGNSINKMKKLFFINIIFVFLPSISYSNIINFENCYGIEKTSIETQNNKKNFVNYYEKYSYKVDSKLMEIQHIIIYKDNRLNSLNERMKQNFFKKISNSYYPINYIDDNYVNSSGKEFNKSLNKEVDWSLVINIKNKIVTSLVGDMSHKYQCE